MKTFENHCFKQWAIIINHEIWDIKILEFLSLPLKTDLWSESSLANDVMHLDNIIKPMTKPSHTHIQTRTHTPCLWRWGTVHYRIPAVSIIALVTIGHSKLFHRVWWPKQAVNGKSWVKWNAWNYSHKSFQCTTCRESLYDKLLFIFFYLALYRKDIQIHVTSSTISPRTRWSLLNSL